MKSISGRRPTPRSCTAGGQGPGPSKSGPTISALKDDLRSGTPAGVRRPTRTEPLNVLSRLTDLALPRPQTTPSIAPCPALGSIYWRPDPDGKTPVENGVKGTTTVIASCENTSATWLRLIDSQEQRDSVGHSARRPRFRPWGPVTDSIWSTRAQAAATPHLSWAQRRRGVGGGPVSRRPLRLLSASQDMTLRFGTWTWSRTSLLVSLYFAGDDWTGWPGPRGLLCGQPPVREANRLAGQPGARPNGSVLTCRPVPQVALPSRRDQTPAFDGSTDNALRSPTGCGPRMPMNVETAGVLRTEAAHNNRLHRERRSPTRLRGKNAGEDRGCGCPPAGGQIAAPRSGTQVTASKLEVKAIARGRTGQPVTGAAAIARWGCPYQGKGA